MKTFTFVISVIQVIVFIATLIVGATKFDGEPDSPLCVCVSVCAFDCVWSCRSLLLGRKLATCLLFAQARSCRATRWPGRRRRRCSTWAARTSTRSGTTTRSGGRTPASLVALHVLVSLLQFSHFFSAALFPAAFSSPVPCPASWRR